MKSTIKLFLVVILFSSVVFAEEGNMGTGNRTCPNGQTTCFVSGSTTGDEETKSTEPTDSTDLTGSTDSILVSVTEYFESMLEYFQN
jgi:hypothetical protein